MVIMAIGVLPETSLAIDSGLTVGLLGGISVNTYYPTNDENIYAIEVMHQLTGEPTKLALAAPAQKQV